MSTLAISRRNINSPGSTSGVLNDMLTQGTLPERLGDAALYSYACICAISLRRLFEDDWHREFKAQMMSKLLCHMKQPPQVSVSITAILEGVGIDDTDPFVKVMMTDPLLEESCIPVLADLVMFVVKDGCYDSRMRVLIKRIAWYVHVRWELVEELECKVAEKLSAQGYKVSDEEEKERKHQALKSKAKRYGLIGLATVGGGVLIGLTGGLAAPLVAAGAGAIIGGASAAVLGSAAGVAIIGSLFGVAGAGLTGYKMKRRVGQVEEFGFELLTQSLQANQNLATCSSSQSLHVSFRSTPRTTPSPLGTPKSGQNYDSNLSAYPESHSLMDPLNVCEITSFEKQQSDTSVPLLPNVLNSTNSMPNAQDNTCTSHIVDNSSLESTSNVACQNHSALKLTSSEVVEPQLQTHDISSANVHRDSNSLSSQNVSDDTDPNSASFSGMVMSSESEYLIKGDMSHLASTQDSDDMTSDMTVSAHDNHEILGTSSNQSKYDNTGRFSDEVHFESHIDDIDMDCEGYYDVKRTLADPLLNTDMTLSSEPSLSVLNVSKSDVVASSSLHSNASQNSEKINLPITLDSNCNSSPLDTDNQRGEQVKMSSASSGESGFSSEDFIDLTTEDDYRKLSISHPSSSRSSCSSANGSSISASDRGSSTTGVKHSELAHQLHMSIAVTGWLNTSMTDFRHPWRNLAHSPEQYSLRWEAKYLLELGKAMDYIVSFAVSYATQEVLKYTVLSSLIAAVTWPVTLVAAAGVIDNPWSVCIQRAHSAGRQLAEVLLAREQGRRPVTLIGYSMGARVVFSCLEELARRKGSEGIVEDVILLGAPVSADVKKWQPLARVIAGQVINGYCRGDWLLKFLHRTASAQFSIAGLKAVRWENRRMCNMDLSDLVTGHMDYMSKLDEILNLIGVRMRTEEIDHNVCVAEEIQENETKIYDKTSSMTIM